MVQYAAKIPHMAPCTAKKRVWTMDEIYPFLVVIRQAISHIDYCFNRSIMEVALEKVPGIHGEEYRVLIS
jgi:hypothetical protein